ncbi:MAG: hypothetical protein EHM70_25755, partial [Chloroflexota bacterium]
MEPSGESKPPKLTRLLADIKRDPAEVQPGGLRQLDPRLEALRVWQSQRLVRTYTDLLADKRFAAACEFFLSDIYSAKDFSQRDHDFEHLYERLKPVLPASSVQLLAESISLNRLTHDLDARLAQALFDEMGVEAEITAEQFAAGYRLCDNYQDRFDQISRLGQVLREACDVARHPLVAPSLKVTKLPARKAGWEQVH